MIVFLACILTLFMIVAACWQISHVDTVVYFIGLPLWLLLCFWLQMRAKEHQAARRKRLEEEREAAEKALARVGLEHAPTEPLMALAPGEKTLVAVARERHFGRAAEACFVSQPTLSVAIKKLEEELDVKIFERGANEVTMTPLGEDIVRQAQSVIEQASAIKDIAKRGKDPLDGPLRLGIIYTIGPYLLPELVKHCIDLYPRMPLMLQENFTQKLLDMLRTGELDCAIMAEPFPDAGLAVAPLYDESFVVAVPAVHPLAKKERISAEERTIVDERGHLCVGLVAAFGHAVHQLLEEIAVERLVHLAVRGGVGLLGVGIDGRLVVADVVHVGHHANLVEGAAQEERVGGDTAQVQRG